MLKMILAWYEQGLEALDEGASLQALIALPVRERISRLKYVPEEELGSFAEVERQLQSEIAALLSEEGV